ncbi:hypothetical protein V3C10_10025 [[Clostridium] symbiosum]|uniref:hypothetical protein n=1 Tax=Clostridium symbiosum TaxID=1512 RepID=UPI001D069491|nr:hypothetical protein [[Clostridium] symbiosum]MCB6610278.1 hypothetical protein [[Clostridium] symbiosum]MCB6929432.1 hypothetical protein [[Clostridium] symbiosum]
MLLFLCVFLSPPIAAVLAAISVWRYTLRSGITDGTFTVKSENYETGSGSFGRLHLSDDYGDRLRSHLRAGEGYTCLLRKDSV